MILSLLTTAALAGGGYGTNHPDVRWQTLETEHFYFHWPESKRDVDDPHYFTTRFTTEKLSGIAEASYSAITDQFDYDLEEKVHVVIYDQNIGWEGNGFAIAEWDWTGFAADWGPLFRMRGRMEFLSDVFVHEFAHIVSLKVYLPWSEAASGFQLGGLVADEAYFDRVGFKPPVRTNADVGFDLMFTAHTPFWWAEGGAEYWSEMAGYNHWGTSRDAFLRMSVLEDRVLGIDERTTRMDKHGFDGERGYNHGYAFGRYLRDRFDRDIYSETAQISRRRWHWTWDRVMEEATGEPMEDLYSGWRTHLDEYYGAQKANVDAAGLVAGRELSLTKQGWEFPDDDWDKLNKNKRDEAMDGPTAWMELSKYSPDSSYIAWFDRGLNVMRIKPEEWGAIGGTYFDEDDTKKMRQLDRATHNTDWVRYLPVCWSADSKQLVVVGGEDDNAPDFARYQGLTFDGDGYNWNQLYIGTLRDGKKGKLEIDWARIPNTLWATEAAFSPDGQQLAFSRYGDGTNELWTMNVDGSGGVQHTQFADGTQIQGIRYTSDGKSLVMGLYRDDRQDVWEFDLASSTFTRITDSEADELDPTLGPDDKLWFASDVDGIYNVYSLDRRSGETTKHTELYGGAYGPDVTADGHLTYTAFTGHGYRIRMVNQAELKREIVDYPGVCVGEKATCG